MRDPVPFQHPWPEKLLGEIAKVTVGGTPSTAIARYWDGDVPWMASGDIHLGRIYDVSGRITDVGLKASNATLVKPDAVAIALAGQGKTRGTVALTKTTLCTNQSVALISPDERELLPAYLYQSWIPRYEELRNRSAGGGRAGLTKAILEQVPVQLPPLAEQRGIAEVLSALDEQIEAVEHEKAKLTQVLIGAFDDTFGQALQAGVTSAGLKSGALTVGWSRVPVLEAASDILDFRGRTPLKIGMTWGGGDIPALSANNVQMGLVNFEKECYLGSDALYTKWMTQGECAQNDVLMTLEAPLGNIALVPDNRKYILSQRVILLKPNKEMMDGRYLSLYLRWRWFQQLLSEESTGTTAAGIQRKKLEKLPVLVAPPGMRDGITDFLFSLVTQVDDFEAEVAKLRLQKQGLMRDLLTGKVRIAGGAHA